MDRRHQVWPEEKGQGARNENSGYQYDPENNGAGGTAAFGFGGRVVDRCIGVGIRWIIHGELPLGWQLAPCLHGVVNDFSMEYCLRKMQDPGHHTSVASSSSASVLPLT